MNIKKNTIKIKKDPNDRAMNKILSRYPLSSTEVDINSEINTNKIQSDSTTITLTEDQNVNDQKMTYFDGRGETNVDISIKEEPESIPKEKTPPLKKDEKNLFIFGAVAILLILLISNKNIV
jgi:hypothetical protein